MSLKNWFSRQPSDGDSTEQTLDELVAARKFDEAIRLLEAKAKLRPGDVHVGLKLADVFARAGETVRAVDAYIAVADTYAKDGFYDRGLGLLAKAEKLAPGHREILVRIARIQKAKDADRKRTLVTRAMVGANRGDSSQATRAMVEGQRFWENLKDAHLIERLSDEHLKQLFANLEILHFDAEEVLVVRGDYRDEIFIVAEGAVQAQAKLPNGNMTTVREFLPGEFFGERALFERRTWPATYAAQEASVILMLDRPSLETSLMGNADPRGLIEVLREANLDEQVEQAVKKMESG